MAPIALALSPVTPKREHSSSYFPLAEKERTASPSHASASSPPASPSPYATSSRKLTTRTRLVLVIGCLSALVFYHRRTRTILDPSPYLPFPLNDHVLPDQLGESISSARPTWEDAFQRPQPLLEAVQRTIRGLSRDDARLYDALVEHLPRGENRSSVCGTLYDEATANQRKHSTSKLIAYTSTWMVGDVVGLADRMKAIVSTFATAYVLGIPWYVRWEPTEMLAAENALEAPHLDWAWKDAWPSREDPDAAFIMSFNGPVGIDYGGLAALRTRRDVEDLLIPKPVNVYTGNIGHIASILAGEDSWIGQELRRRGMRMPHAYGCMLGFLFQPLLQTRHALAPYQAVLALPSVLSVAIQIRTGDGAFEGEEEAYPTSNSRHFFRCATDYALTRARPHHRLVVFYLATDSATLHRLAAANPTTLLPPWNHPTLPAPMLLVGPGEAMHARQGTTWSARGATSNGTDMASEEGRQRLQKAMQYAVFENYLMDSADAHVISDDSGYGLVSALRSFDRKAEPSAFIMPPPDEPRPAVTIRGRACSAPDGAHSLDELRNQWGFA